MNNAADKALLLEEELEEYPDDRGDILVEAAQAWRQAGNHDRAIELLTEAATLGGVEGGTARVSLAGVLFGLGRADEARAQLEALRKDPPTDPEPFHEAAELTEKHGELDEALAWFDFAVARLDADERADSYITVGRRRVRRRLGLPPDDLDDAVEQLARGMDDLVRRLTSKRSGQVHILFWQRAEVRLAHEKWPEIMPHTDADTTMCERELANRELTESGARVVMVPLTVERLTEFANRTGRDPLNAETGKACLPEILADGLAIPWPPERNAPCWCGSAIKYKKCCGRLR